MFSLVEENKCSHKTIIQQFSKERNKLNIIIVFIYLSIKLERQILKDAFIMQSMKTTCFSTSFWESQQGFLEEVTPRPRPKG